MKITAVYFSFGPDGNALVESVKSVRRVYGDSCGICVFDDASNPVTGDVLDKIRPNLYEQTTFERRGNLNGPECVAGMLRAFEKSIIATRADIMIKMDCDTMITRDWLDHERRWGLQGVWFATRALVSGLCYAMDRESPRELIRAVSGREIWEGPCPEDATISVLSSVHLTRGVKITDCSKGQPGSIAVGYCFQPRGVHNLEIYAKYPIVTFGNRSGIPGFLTPEQRRQKTADKMWQFNLYLDARQQHPFPPVS